MSHVAREFAKLLAHIRQAIDGVDGWLTDREIQFLALAGARPTCAGDVLEIGSYRGRSTIVLAIAEQMHRAGTIYAVDPLPDEPPMAADCSGKMSARALWEDNLRRAGVRQRVEFTQGYSYELAETWDRPLRLLWIDGDHSYRSTRQDFDLFSPHLADRGVLAMHDVLSRYDGCIRVFLEQVLASDHFGAAGLCGSIGWAQFHANPEASAPHRRAKEQLARRLEPLVSYHCQETAPVGWSKLRYKWLRARVPHRRVAAPEQWLAKTA